MRKATMKVNTTVNRSFPEYKSINDAYEHFRLITILFKYDGVPAEYLKHMKKQVAKFKHKLDKVSVKKINEMKTLLNGLEQTFSDSFKKMVSESSNDESFILALKTKKKDDGIVIGDYFIKIINTNNQERKLYTVFGADRKPIITDLYLYEIAYILVHYFHNGFGLDNPEVDSLMDLHAEYKKIANNYSTQKSNYAAVKSDDPNLNYHKNMVSGLKNSLNQVYSQVNSKYSRLINQEKTK
jgi:hypothetical protein